MKMNVKAALSLFAAVAVSVGVAGVSNPASAADPTQVTVAGQTHALNGVNIYRSTNYLVEYTPAKGATTGTNQYGCEAAVVNGAVTKVENGAGNMAIPSNGFVLSGHGTSRTWLCTYAKVGSPVSFDGSTGGGGGGTGTGTALLPDVGIRTLRAFTIVNSNGKKLLKFPGVTANVGKGPLEVVGHRSSSTSTDWVATQHIYNSDGSKTDSPAPSLTFYYAGDGHNHWHMKDFDSYELFDASGRRVATGEKHGFCFEDNTSYRDWPSNHTNGAPSSPVYDPSKVCGVNQPTTTDIMHGLSVGWGDTYPASLPDQAINITGISDGTYKVQVCADAANNIKEASEGNNCATAQVRITGNTVSLLSANDGL